MLIRQATIIFFIGIIFGLVGFVFIQSISPFRTSKLEALIEENEISEGEDEKLNLEIQRLVDDGLILNYLSTNVYIGVLIFLCSFFCFFLTIHLCIDKLFFKKFFEKASYFDGARRGVLFCIAISLMLYFRLLNLALLEILLIPLIIILLEIIFFKYFKKDFLKSVEEFKLQYEHIFKLKNKSYPSANSTS